jgi:hypothetical protein
LIPGDGFPDDLLQSSLKAWARDKTANSWDTDTDDDDDIDSNPNPDHQQHHHHHQQHIDTNPDPNDTLPNLSPIAFIRDAHLYSCFGVTHSITTVRLGSTSGPKDWR